MSDLDLFERELSDRLHAHDLPARVADLADSSARRGTRIRHRRQAGLGVVMAALLIIPGVAWTAHRDQAGPPPAATVSAPIPGTGPTGDFSQLPAGPAPTVGYVLNSVWHRADGSTRALTAADRADGAVSWVPYGDHLLVTRDRSIGNDGTYSIDAGPEQAFPTVGSETAGVAYPGPAGSVLVPADDALLVLDRNGRWHRNTSYAGIPDARDLPQPSRDYLWTSRTDSEQAGVVQVRSLDTDAGRKRFDQWDRVATADPASDQVALTDRTGCNDIVDGSTGVSRWHSCEWTFSSFSPDRRFVMATGASGTAMLDITTRSVVYRLPTANVSEASGYHFAADGTMAFVVMNPADGQAQAIAACDATGACWRATDWSKDHAYVIVDRSS